MVLATVGDGIALGFVTWVLVELFTGRAKNIRPFAYVLTVIFALHYVFA
jgi:AGZA family xanthine/uracil permease-like MFS transporter